MVEVDSNYAYRPSKVMVSVFMKDFRNRLYAKKVNVTSAKLGFVNISVTKSFYKNLFLVSPKGVASDNVHLPWFLEVNYVYYSKHV